MMRSRLLLPTALLLLASGCGSGEDDAAAAKAAYVERASAVCAQASEARQELAPPTAVSGFAPYVRELLAIGERASTELAAIEPPAADREELQAKLLDPLAAQVEQGKSFADKVEAAGEDQAALAGLLGEAPTGEGIDLDFLRAYGLDACVDAAATTG